MAYKLSNTGEVFHTWAHQFQARGESGNVSFVGASLYSYAACIARFLNARTVALTYRTWSPTTSSHQSAARAAVSHLKRVYCWNPDHSVFRNMQHERDIVTKMLAGIPAPVMKKDGKTETHLSKKRRENIYADVKRKIEQANEYLAATGNTEITPIELGDDIKKAAEEIRRIEDERRVLAEQAAKRREAEAQETLEKWRNHEWDQSVHGVSPALRRSPDRTRVQTSWGAQIPVEHALRLWPLVKRYRRMKANFLPVPGTDNVIKLGNFQLDKIDETGSIKVGCHTIGYSELERIAEQLNLSKEAEE
jgi:hypothetical protein